MYFRTLDGGLGGVTEGTQAGGLDGILTEVTEVVAAVAGVAVGLEETPTGRVVQVPAGSEVVRAAHRPLLAAVHTGPQVSL